MIAGIAESVVTGPMNAKHVVDVAMEAGEEAVRVDAEAGHRKY